MGKNTLAKLLALLMAFGLVAAACGSDDPVDTTGDTTDTTAADDTATSETTAADDTATTEAAAGGGADGVLTLGGILPETGNLAFLGPPEFAGVDLAIADINAAGGVLGSPIEWLPGDSGDNGEVANATVDRLLAQDVDGFIGAASSGVSLTVIDKITQAGKIHFSPANTSAAFTDYADNGLYFRTAPADVVQAERDKVMEWDAAIERIGAQLQTLARE